MLTGEKIDSHIAKLKFDGRPFISGRRIENKKLFEKTSSIDGRVLAPLGICDQADVARAVQVAEKTYVSRIWVDQEPADKKAVLLRLADLMTKHREELALLDTLETGRAYQNYFNDSIPKAIEVVRWYAESVDKYMDHAIPPRANAFAAIVRSPLGVVGSITPWNDPLVPAMWKMAPALLMGNSLVMKPAEQSSYSLLRIAELAQEAGLPDGVLNVITGPGEITGKYLALDPIVAGIFFTGSSEVGKLILQYSGQSNMKKVGLECGGKSPFIVSKNCKDLKTAAAVLAQNVFYNQGQICSAPSRLLIDQEIKSEFMAELKQCSKQYAPQNPLDPAVKVGCMVSEQQKNRVLDFVESAKKNLDFYQVKSHANAPVKGQFVNPVIFDGVQPSDALFQEEVFGPVISVTGFKDLSDALQLANQSKYGLAAAIFTNDLDEAYNISRRLEAGIVHVNSYGEDDNSVPFGGVKQSGLGRDKSWYAFDEYSELKTIWMKFKNLE